MNSAPGMHSEARSCIQGPGRVFRSEGMQGLADAPEFWGQWA
jgi:hypothetical protein